MIGNSLPELVFIRLSILALRALPHVSLAFLLFVVSEVYDVVHLEVLERLLYGSSQWLGYALISVASVEVGFYAIFLWRLQRIQAPPKYFPPPTTRAERREVFEKCCLDPVFESLDPRYPEGWFFPYSTTSTMRSITKVPDSKEAKPRLSKRDVEEWVNSVFSLPDVEGDAEAEEEMKEYLQWVEERMGVKLEDEDGEHDVNLGEGSWWQRWTGNTAAEKTKQLKRKMAETRSMRVTTDPVTALHRPLIWYLIVLLVDTITSLILLSSGFRHFSLSSNWFSCFPPRPILAIPGFSTNTRLMTEADVGKGKEREVLLPWWYREHKAGKDALPVVFFHGIGIGLHPYTPFLRSLPPTTGVIAFELLPISMHMTRSTLPPRPLMIQAVNRVLEGVGWDKVVVVGHSYGTFLIGGMVKEMTWPSSDTESTEDRAEAPTLCPSDSTSSTATRSTDVDVEPEEAGLLPTSFTHTSNTSTSPSQSVTTTSNASLYSSSTFYPPSLPSTHESLRRKIAHVVLVDPIPILLHLPSIAYNFLYRHPDPWIAAQWQLWYFASRDADVGRQLGRGMFWREGCMDLKDLRDVCRGSADSEALDMQGARRGDLSGGKKGRNVAVVIAGEDQIIPAKFIRQYLTGEESSSRTEGYWKADGWGWKTSIDKPTTDTLVDVEEAEETSSLERSVYGDLEVIYTHGIDHASIFDRKDGVERVREVVARFSQGI